MEKNKKNWKILCILCIVGALICIDVVCVNSIRQKNAAERMSHLSQVPAEVSSIPEETPDIQPVQQEPTQAVIELSPEEFFAESVRSLEEAGIPIPEKEIDIATLKESENEDIYGWIYIPDTKIDYPVLQHPEDDTYYLNRNIDGSKGYPGCIYSEGTYNNREFADANTVLYGHNMKNGSMFANLHKFEDEEFFTEHPYIYIYTDRKLLVYEIFAAYAHGSEHLLYNYDFSDSVIFRRYFDSVMGERAMNNNFREDVELSGEERILTLSTCIANKPDKRYLVQGVLLNED